MKVQIENKSKLYIALITTLISLIILVTGTYAWFTLSLSGKVQEMELKVTAGDSLFVDTVYHATVDDFHGNNFVSTTAIESQIATTYSKSGLTLGGISMTPVTSGNGKAFYNEEGNSITASALHYLQFDLYFIGTKDMGVYLGGDSTAGDDGTLVRSKDSANSDSQKAIDKCVRISFEDTTLNQDAKIYEPNKNSTTTTLQAIAGGGNQRTFETLGSGSGGTKLFDLTANTTKKIRVTIWLEGQDAQCVDSVKLAVFLARLRFIGV